MANWQSTNINTGAVEKTKYFEIGEITTIWKVALTTAFANGDVILGPTLPAGTWLTTLTMDVGSLDSSTGVVLEAGYTGHLAAFIAASTVGQGGGIQGLNVPGSIGFTSTTDTQILVTSTHVATTPVAGNVVISLKYTANP